MTRNAPTGRCTPHASSRSGRPAPPHALTERPQLLELWQTHRVAMARPVSCRSPIVHRAITSDRQRSPPNGGHPDCCGRPNPSLAQGHLQKHVLQLHGTPVQRHSPVGISFSPEPLPQHTQHDGGQRYHVGGHIGRCASTGKGASEVSCTGEGGKVEGPVLSPWTSAKQ